MAVTAREGFCGNLRPDIKMQFLNSFCQWYFFSLDLYGTLNYFCIVKFRDSYTQVSPSKSGLIKDNPVKNRCLVSPNNRTRS